MKSCVIFFCSLFFRVICVRVCVSFHKFIISYDFLTYNCVIFLLLKHWTERRRKKTCQPCFIALIWSWKKIKRKKVSTFNFSFIVYVNTNICWEPHLSSKDEQKKLWRKSFLPFFSFSISCTPALFEILHFVRLADCSGSYSCMSVWVHSNTIAYDVPSFTKHYFYVVESSRLIYAWNVCFRPMQTWSIAASNCSLRLFFHLISFLQFQLFFSSFFCRIFCFVFIPT